jgi:hypothetical protein
MIVAFVGFHIYIYILTKFTVQEGKSTIKISSGGVVRRDLIPVLTATL